MTSGIQGTGPYSKLRDLRFEKRQLQGELDNRPMGSRTRKRKERELRLLKSKIREVNEEIAVAKQKTVDSAPPTQKSAELEGALAAEARYFDKMSHPDSGTNGLLRAYGGPDILAVAEAGAKADVEAGFDPKRLIPTKAEAEAGLRAHIAAMTSSRSKRTRPKRRD